MTISDACYKQINDQLSTVVRAKRKSLNMSQEDLAFLVGHSRNCIQQIECTEHGPDFETFFLLDEGLHLSEEEAVSLFLDIRAFVREDREKEREEAGTQHIAVWLWRGKPKEDFIYTHV